MCLWIAKRVIQQCKQPTRCNNDNLFITLINSTCFGRHFRPSSGALDCVFYSLRTLVQAQRLCTRRTTHRGSRGIALLFLDNGTRSGWGVSVTPRPLFTPGKDPVPIVQEAGWAPGPVWKGAKNLAPTGIRSPDGPARSQSLYRLSYLAHPSLVVTFK